MSQEVLSQEGHGHGGLHRWLLGRPVLLGVLFATVSLIGLIALQRIPLQMMPDGMSGDGMQIVVVHPGSDAAENEEEVTRPIEDELRTLQGVRSIESSTRQGMVFIWLELRADADMEIAKADVRDRLERARPRLPASVREIGLFSWSMGSMPIAFVAVLHSGDSPRTDFLLEEVVKRRLEAVDGVGRVEVWGSLADSLRILLDEDRVRAAGLDLGALIRRLASDNFAQPLGEIDDGGSVVLLRSDMRFESAEEIEDYPIGGGLRIRDVGHVEMVKSVRERLSRMDGRYVYFAQIDKDGRANAVDASRRMRAALKELENDPQLEGELRFVSLFDQGEFIENSLQELTGTAITGGLLAVLILFVFLWRARLTVLIALSIPFSTLIALAWNYFAGGSFNILTMMGLTLASGMLVDNSIVVAENVTRLRALGRPVREACAVGAAEVGLAVLLSTLTTVVVFAPMIFLSENPELRVIFGEIGRPLCVSLLASLLAALVFLPVQVHWALGSRPRWVERFWARVDPILALPALGARQVIGIARRAAQGSLTLLSRVLLQVVRVVAPLRWLLAAAFLALGAWRARAALPALESAGSAGPFELVPGGAQSGVMALAGPIALAVLGALLAPLVLGWARARLAPYAPPARDLVPRARSLVALIADGMHALAAWTLDHRWAGVGLGVLGVLSIVLPANNMKVASFGQDQDAGRLNFWVRLEENFTLQQAEDEMLLYERFLEERRERWGFERLLTRFNHEGGRLSLFWDPPPTQDEQQAVMRELRETLPRIAGHELRFVDDEERGGQSTTVVTFRLVGPSAEELDRLGAQALKLLERVPGLEDLRSPLSNAPPQVEIQLQSEVAQRLGVSARNALENVSWALSGIQLPSFHEPGREVPLLIEFDEAKVAGLDTLRDLEVFTGESAVPLSSFANLEFGRGQRSIERNDGRASFTIQARVDSPAEQAELSAAGRRALQALDLPRGYELAQESMADVRIDEEMSDIWGALALSIVLVFLLMGILFESCLLPVSVMFTVPFAVVGAYWSLWLTGTAMDSIGWIGVIVLVGVVVNNGIVLVARVTQLRDEGLERRAAVLQAVSDRMRPILMTALTSVAGLVPMALSEPHGEGIDYRALATCVAGGLTISTLFTLWVVPLAYTVLDDLAHALAAQAAWAFRRGRPASEAPRSQPAA